MNLEKFLNICSESSSSAYHAFVELNRQLKENKTRAQARIFLGQLKNQSELFQPNLYHFQLIKQSILDGHDKPNTLTLIQFPSTFLPEAWSFTFYEGLIRYPVSEYHSKNIVELGCGIGWISIALAIRFQPHQMVGLDINPKAVVCAELNAFMNGLDDEGNEIVFANDFSLINCLSFHTSDLLSHFYGKKNYFDKIIGCIPQVLNPEPEVMHALIADSASDEYLHSLSNYTAQQGYIEDQFGLGLIAKAVEQSIEQLKPNGKLILNLGGRPGRSVLERLMQRRGFMVRRVWQTQVEQAADTGIDALVQIEKQTDHRFEFYMAADQTTAIDATTAQAYAQQGGKIFHSVDVYEATLVVPSDIKVIYQSIMETKSDRLRSAVDLTFDNREDAEERYAFLRALTGWLAQHSHFPYEETAGLLSFRQQISEYFHYYHKVDCTAEQIFIAPGRKELFNNTLRCYRPPLTFVSKQLKPFIDKDLDLNLLEVPAQIELITKLIAALKPTCVMTEIDPLEIQSAQQIKMLIDCCVDNQTILILDASKHLELSSQPPINGLYRYLAQHPLPSNVVVTLALINNRVYQDYSLNISLINNASLFQDLTDAAELSYSRSPVMPQLYYSNLIEELLYFQRTRAISKASVTQKNEPNDSCLSLSDSAKQAFSQPAIVGNRLAFDHNTVRLDYGENELSSPTLLKEVLLESFLVRKFPGNESNPSEPLRRILQHRLGFNLVTYSKVFFSEGVAPLYSALLKQCCQEQATLLIPTGSYGYFSAASEFHQVKKALITTTEDEQFKLSAQALLAFFATQPDVAKTRYWLFLNAPIVNPTGALYTEEELLQIAQVCADHGVTLVMDAIFTGLEFPEQTAQWRLQGMIDKLLLSEQGRFVLMSGLSKEYSAGGLRVGYLWSPSTELMEQVKLRIHRWSHYTMGYATRELFEAHSNSEPTLMAHLKQQSSLLALRAKTLSEVLSKKGWKVIPPQGGLFLVAKPPQVTSSESEVATEQADKAVLELFEQYNLVINNSTWTGIPGYCRWVLSTSEHAFASALKRLDS